MNYNLDFIPERTAKPRQSGLTMMMDKGLSVRQVEDFLSASSELTDIVKLGFGTSYVTKNIEQKIKLYKEAGMTIYLGGTLFEAFLIRNQFDDYIQMLKDFDIHYIEVSDGSINIPHAEKCGYI